MKPRSLVTLLALLLAATLALDGAWLCANRYPPAGDEPIHLLNALALGAHFWPSMPGFFSSQYPPLTYLVTHLFFSAFGPSLTGALLCVALFHGLFVCAVAFLGGTLDGLRGGVLFGLVALGTPLLHEFAHRYLIDVPLAATVALALAAHFACKDFTRPRPTIVLGLAIALGMLTKWTFLLFYGVPALVMVWATIRKAPRLELVYVLLCGGFTLASMWLQTNVPTAPWFAHSLGLCHGVWVVLLGWAWRRRVCPGSDGWNAASGLAIVAALSVLGTLWWYWYGLSLMSGVVGYNYQLERNPFVPQLHFYVDALLRTVWAGPLWLSIGLAVGLWRAQCRPAVLLCALTLVAVVPLSAAMARVDARYILPAVPFVIVVMFAWTQVLRHWIPLALLLGTVTLLQSAGWVPGVRVLQGIVRVQIVPTPREPARGIFSFFTSVPAAPPPFTDANPYPELLDELARAHVTTLQILSRVPLTEVRNTLLAYGQMQRLPLWVMFPNDVPADERQRQAVLVASYDFGPPPPGASASDLLRSPALAGYRHVRHWNPVTIEEAQGRLPSGLDLFLRNQGGVEESKGNRRDAAVRASGARR